MDDPSEARVASNAQAGEALPDAKHDVDPLASFAEDRKRYVELAREIEGLRDCRDGLRAHFAQVKLALVDERLARFEDVIERLNAQIVRLETRREDRGKQVEQLRYGLAADGTDRIERLEAEIHRLEGLRDMRRLKAERHGALARRIGETAVADESAFIAQRMHWKTLRNEARDRDAGLDAELVELHVERRLAAIDRDALRAEVDGLKGRRGNIDADRLRIRSLLGAALGIEEAAMPFAGELLQVREEERAWEGAAERLLRGFGLSLLVPDRYRQDVSAWIESNHLDGHLAYICVEAAVHCDELPDLHRDSLVRKLSIAPDAPHRDWLARELALRFDYACCATHDQFCREARALTLAGQIKDSSGRHEKNDRHRIDDRSCGVLGWNNAARIVSIESRLSLIGERLKEIDDRIAKVQDQRKLVGERLDALVRLEEYVDFADLDWGRLVAEIDVLVEERQRLRTVSDITPASNERLVQAVQVLEATQTELDVAKDRRSRIQQRKADTHEIRKLVQADVQQAPSRTHVLAPEERARRLEAIRAEATGDDAAPSIEACDSHERETGVLLQRRIDAEEIKLKRLRDSIIQAKTLLKVVP